MTDHIHKSLLTNETHKTLSPEQIARNKVRSKTWVTSNKPSLTEQHHKNSTNINNILNQYKNNPELLLNTNNNSHLYGDFSQATDYQTSLNTIMHAEEQFNALPSKTREKFHNSPLEFLEFVENNKSPEALVELGIAVPHNIPKTLDDVHQSLEKHFRLPTDPDYVETPTGDPRASKKKTKDS